jgi:hypothetical protein
MNSLNSLLIAVHEIGGGNKAICGSFPAKLLYLITVESDETCLLRILNVPNEKGRKLLARTIRSPLCKAEDGDQRR